MNAIQEKFDASKAKFYKTALCKKFGFKVSLDELREDTDGSIYWLCSGVDRAGDPVVNMCCSVRELSDFAL